MITYIETGKNNLEYTVLFDKASVKLGLKPFEKEIGVDNDGQAITEPWKYYQDSGEWKTKACVPYDTAAGADNSNADFNEEGDFLITRTENGVTEKVVSKGISSLNEYFQHITQLAELAIGQGRTGSDPYFLRLPLDEPYFEINANTRAISVPAELSQIGVIGDKLAEVLFFKIDRYFDAVDLNTRQIYIEWKDAAGNLGISRDFLRDVQSEKDKLIFGWAIGEELTHTVGTITFAVRFVEWTDRNDKSNSPLEGTGLAYSFSSLPASVTISDSLHYSLFENDTDFAVNSDYTDTLAHNLKFYLEDSEPDAADETAPALSFEPIYVRNLDVVNNEPATVITANELYQHNLIGGAKGQPEGYLDLIAEAYANDGGTLTYMFGRKAYDYSGTDALVTKMIFLPVSDTSANDRTYFVKDETGAYVPVSRQEITANETAGNEVQYYEKVAKTTVKLPGYYHVSTRNRVDGKKTNTKDSFTLYVPYAAVPTVQTQMAKGFVLNHVDYSLEKDPTIDQTLTRDAEKSNIRIVGQNASDYSSEIILRPVVAASDGSGTENFTYTWYWNEDIYTKDVTGAIKNAERYISRADGLTNQVWEDRKAEILSQNGWVKIEGEHSDEATYKATAPGCYMLIVSNHFNNDDRETNFLDAGICRVTQMPTIPIIDWEAFRRVIAAGKATQPELLVDEVDHDNMHFTWYQISSLNEDMDPVAEGALEVVEDDLTFVDGVAKIPFLPQKEGYFYFILSNTLNGATVYMNSATSYAPIKVSFNTTSE